MGTEFEQIIFVIGQGHIRPNKIIFVRSMIMHLPWPYYAYICYKNCLNVYGVQWQWIKFLYQRWRSQQIFIKSNFGGHVTIQLLTSAVFYNILSPDIDLLSNSYFSQFSISNKHAAFTSIRIWKSPKVRLYITIKVTLLEVNLDANRSRG